MKNIHCCKHKQSKLSKELLPRSAVRKEHFESVKWSTSIDRHIYILNYIKIFTKDGNTKEMTPYEL